MKFLLLLVAVALIESSWALKCRRCKDPKDDTCKELESETCLAPPSNQEAACQIYIYKLSKDAKTEVTEKKCVNRNKDGNYACVATPGSVEIKCTTCTEDYCNEKSGASTVKVGSWAVSVLLAIVASRFL